MANYSGARIVNCQAVSGDTLKGHNFAQESPGTKILIGLTGLTFVDCNLVNCSPPSDSVVENCNLVQVSRHTEACPVDCEHLVSSEDIIVDGVVVDTLRQYEDKVVGLWPVTL